MVLFFLESTLTIKKSDLSFEQKCVENFSNYRGQGLTLETIFCVTKFPTERRHFRAEILSSKDRKQNVGIYVEIGFRKRL